MASLLVRPTAPDAQGTVIDVTPESAGWTHVGFRVHKLAKGQRLEASSDDQEICLVLLTGRATVTCGEHRFEDIGQRMDIFEQIPPYAVYLPDHVSYAVEATTDLELAVCTAPGHGNHAPRLIAPDNIKGSPSSACTPMTAALMKPWRWRTVAVCWCPKATTQWARLMATRSTT